MHVDGIPRDVHYTGCKVSCLRYCSNPRLSHYCDVSSRWQFGSASKHPTPSDMQHCKIFISTSPFSSCPFLGCSHNALCPKPYVEGSSHINLPKELRLRYPPYLRRPTRLMDEIESQNSIAAGCSCIDADFDVYLVMACVLVLLRLVSFTINLFEGVLVVIASLEFCQT